VERVGNQLRYIRSGIIAPKSRAALHYRLATIHDELTLILANSEPQMVAIEDQYVRHARSALVIGQARGACAAAVGAMAIHLHEHSPAGIKKAVAGKGNASKAEVARAVNAILGIDRKMTDDESDALAIAICCAMDVR
jgi:crossover junction endodeoxyribonuclease RuvC